MIKKNIIVFIGVDYNLQSKDNKWVGKLWYHKSFETKNENNFSNGFG